MTSLRSLVLSLALSASLIHPALTATIEQCNSRKVPGSITGPHTGDFLTDTRCDCIKHDAKADSFIPVGHIYQWEYFNYHSNATFVICTKEPYDEMDGCVTAPRDNDPNKEDRFCFGWKIIFNDQHRKLYDQGYRETWDNDCKALCKEFMNDEDVEGAGPRVVYDHIDDMCNTCK